MAFIEFLCFNGLSHAAIVNYITGVKNKLKWYSLDISVFEHPKVVTMLRGVERTAHVIRQPKAIIEVNMLKQMIWCNASLENARMFNCLFLIAYFGFFRISNLAPVNVNSFDFKKHLCRGDVIIQDEGVVIVVKWSKTIRNFSQGTYIVLPKLTGSVLCPHNAVVTWLRNSKGGHNDPLFTINHKPVSQYQIRKHLAKNVSVIGRDPINYPFHSFRRSGPC